MHGARNDFVVVDVRAHALADPVNFARANCDRRAGIGADGVLLVGASTVGDVSMRVINADGSEAEMCGNGVRCVARYIDEIAPVDRLRVETISGIVEAVIVERGETYQVRVNMGVPQIDRSAFDANRALVTIGNRHLLIFAESLDEMDLELVGAHAQVAPEFPDGINVHSVMLDSASDALRMRHYERGVGLTMACGTGAVAAAAAVIARGVRCSPVRVFVPGGELLVDWDGCREAYMTGPAAHVFDTVA